MILSFSKAWYKYNSMEKKLKTICIIPARGGSKGLRGKNIRIFNGKPLIAWPILAAKQCEKIDEIIVTTDSEEIAEKADLKRLKDEYFSIDEYRDLDKRGNRMYSAGFNMLVKFQKSKNI